MDSTSMHIVEIERYIKSCCGDEVYLKNFAGDECAIAINGRQIYARRSNGDEFYPRRSDGSHYYLRNERGAEYYARKFNGREIYLPSGVPVTINGRQVYATDKSGQIYSDEPRILLDENHRQYYARDSAGNEYYPVTASNRYFVIRDNYQPRFISGGHVSFVHLDKDCDVYVTVPFYKGKASRPGRLYVLTMTRKLSPYLEAWRASGLSTEPFLSHRGHVFYRSHQSFVFVNDQEVLMEFDGKGGMRYFEYVQGEKIYFDLCGDQKFYYMKYGKHKYYVDFYDGKKLCRFNNDLYYEFTDCYYVVCLKDRNGTIVKGNVYVGNRRFPICQELDARGNIICYIPRKKRIYYTYLNGEIRYFNAVQSSAKFFFVSKDFKQFYDPDSGRLYDLTNILDDVDESDDSLEEFRELKIT